MPVEIFWEKNKILVAVEPDLQAAFLTTLPKAQFDYHRKLWVVSMRDRATFLLWIDNLARKRSHLADLKMRQIAKGVRNA